METCNDAGVYIFKRIYRKKYKIYFLVILNRFTEIRNDANVCVLENKYYKCGNSIVEKDYIIFVWA